MRIAVTSQNYRTINSHAGRTRRFIVFEAEPGQTPREVDRLDLPREMTFHEFRGEAHPIDGCDTVITGGAGPGFVNRLGARGIEVVITDEPDPMRAVEGLLAGTLHRLAPEHHGHGHSHDHDHDHEH